MALSNELEISETDLFTYYLRKNLWAKGIDFETFVEIIKIQGVKIIHEND